MLNRTRVKDALSAALVGMLVVAAAGPAAAQTAQTLTFSGSAYGTQAFVGGTVLLGKTAFVNVTPCTTQIGLNKSNNTASASDPPLVVTGLTTTNVSTTATSAISTSEVMNVNALSGLITAADVKAVSTTSHGTSGLQVSAAGSVFVSLVVAGVPISATPSPNTTINLPGFGRVVLNEQKSSIAGQTASLTVSMIHVFVTLTNALGIAPGTQIVVADAVSALAIAPGPAALDGIAFGSQVMGTTVTAGKTAVVQLPCIGTEGAVLMNTVASVNVPLALQTGTVTDTAQGTIAASLTTGSTTSTVQTANLVSSLVTADLITAQANASTTDGTVFSFDDNGSGFTHIAVAGHPEITDNVPANTQVSIIGLGTLYLHRLVHTANSLEVRMIELKVTQSNTFGLPIGTDIRVADAEVSLHSAVHP